MITAPIRPGTAARQGIHRPARDEITIVIGANCAAWHQGFREFSDSLGRDMRVLAEGFRQLAEGNQCT